MQKLNKIYPFGATDLRKHWSSACGKIFKKIKQWQRKKEERKRNNFLPPLKGGGQS